VVLAQDAARADWAVATPAEPLGFPLSTVSPNLVTLGCEMVLAECPSLETRLRAELAQSCGLPDLLLGLLLRTLPVPVNVSPTKVLHARDAEDVPFLSLV
jgi:hypothetical protein